jgi:hypothetical protein
LTIMMRQVTSLPDLFFIRYIILIKFPIFYCASISRAFVCNMWLVHNAILVFRDGFGILKQDPESEQAFIAVCQQLLFCGRCQQLPSVYAYIITLSRTTFAQSRPPSRPDSILKVRWMGSGMLFCHQNETSWHTPSQSKKTAEPHASGLYSPALESTLSTSLPLDPVRRHRDFHPSPS